MAVQVTLDLRFGLLLERGGGHAFHHAWTGQAANRFGERELASVADLPFQGFVRRAAALGLVFAHCIGPILVPALRASNHYSIK